MPSSLHSINAMKLYIILLCKFVRQSQHEKNKGRLSVNALCGKIVRSRVLSIMRCPLLIFVPEVQRLLPKGMWKGSVQRENSTRKGFWSLSRFRTSSDKLITCLPPKWYGMRVQKNAVVRKVQINPNFKGQLKNYTCLPEKKQKNIVCFNPLLIKQGRSA